MEYPQNLSASDCRWLDLIQQCRTSGKSDNQWLHEHNVKAPTFYYHIKQLRKKACEIPKSNCTGRNDVQEVVPLFMEELADAASKCTPINTVNGTASICLNLNGVSVGIANNATPEVIKNTLVALRFLC